MSTSAAPKVFFIHFANPGLRIATRSQEPQKRKVDVREWMQFYRGEIGKRISAFYGDGTPLR